MGRLYVVQTNGVNLAEVRDLYEVLAATDKPLRVCGWFLSQTSDVGDAAEQVLRVETVRGVGTVTSGSGGTSPTIHPVDDRDAAAAATVEANNTTRMAVGTGTLETLEQYGWNVRIPWLHVFPTHPIDWRPFVKPGDRWTLAVPAISNALNPFASTLWVEEL